MAIKFACPRARRVGLTSEAIGEEIVIYDSDSHVAHALHADVTQVWNLCDGERSISEIASITGISCDRVRQSVAELDDSGLLEATDGSRFSRRDVMRGAAATGAGALIFSIPVPAAMAAASGPAALAAVGTYAKDASPYYPAFNPAGTLLAVPCPNANALDLFTVNPDGSLTFLSYTGLAGVHAAKFSSNGNFLAVAVNGANMATVYTVTGSTLSNPQSASTGTSSNPVSVAFSPDGTLLAVANQGVASVVLFNVNPTTGALTNAHTTTTVATNVAVNFSPDGKMLVVANQGGTTVTAFPVTAGSTTLCTANPVTSGSGPLWAEFSPSGAFLAVSNNGDSTVSVFSVDTTNNKLTLVGSPFALATGATAPLQVAFSPTGGLLLVTASTQGKVEAFSVNTTTGALTQDGPLITAGAGANGVVCSSQNNVVAVTNTSANTVSTYKNVSGL